MDQAQTLNEHGCSLWKSGRLHAAQAAFEKFLTVAQSQKDEALAATAWNNLAVVLRERGESARASACQQQSWRIAMNHSAADSSSELLSQNLTNLANDAILAGDYKLAERLLRSALVVDTRTGNSADVAADWGGLGIISYLTGRFGQARRAFTRARQIHERLGDDRGLGCDLGHLGQLSLAEQDLPSARRFFERSLLHFECAGCREEAQRAGRMLREVAARQRVAGFCPVRN
ncbi:MAG TPA: tetratricopeptide repeat protein [Planctomycetaceae bacterium]|jgi:tetratricopeptide (TPR) repeat protein